MHFGQASRHYSGTVELGVALNRHTHAHTRTCTDIHTCHRSSHPHTLTPLHPHPTPSHPTPSHPHTLTSHTLTPSHLRPSNALILAVQLDSYPHPHTPHPHTLTPHTLTFKTLKCTHPNSSVRLLYPHPHTPHPHTSHPHTPHPHTPHPHTSHPHTLTPSHPHTPHPHTPHPHTLTSYLCDVHTRDRLLKLQRMNFLPLEGQVSLKHPDITIKVCEDYGPPANPPLAEPLMVYFGRHITEGQRQLAAQYAVKERHFIANTSMDAQLSLMMANQAKVCDEVLLVTVGVCVCVCVCVCVSVCTYVCVCVCVLCRSKLGAWSVILSLGQVSHFNCMVGGCTHMHAHTDIHTLVMW